jgi:diguanylate cyclase (GGDEF)-like protein
MRQNRGRKTQPDQSSHQRISAEHLLSICRHTLDLCRNFYENSKALTVVEDSGQVLKKIERFLQGIKTNQENLEDLKQKLAKNFCVIQTYLPEVQEHQALEIKETIQNLEPLLQSYSFLETESDLLSSRKKALSAGTQYLHSLGFGHIINMIDAASTQEPEWMSRTGTLLILDQNPNTSQALERRLSQERHTILVAENEEQAVEIMQSTSIDLILLDYLVFEDHLYAFLEKIEKQILIGYVPIIVIGASENAEGMQDIIEAGIGDYLAKPVNPVLLKARVRSALEKKHAFDERVKRLQEMQRTRLELETAIQGLPDGFAIFDQDNHMVMHNDKLFDYYPGLETKESASRGGLTFEKLLEANIVSDLYAFSKMGETSKHKWLEEKKENFLRPASQWEESLTNGRTLSITTYRTPDGGGALVAKDISQDRSTHQDLTFLAYHDPLTDLANRKSFQQKLTQSIQVNAQEPEGSFLAVLFLDLDGFKSINDTYGHEMGDWLLTQVAQRLYRSVRGDDLVARMGGDEFSIILNHVPNRPKLEIIVRRILKSISEPYIRGNATLVIGVSIGVSIYASNISDSDVMMKEADTAMYSVKKKGKGHFCFFDEMQDRQRHRQ